MSEEKAIRRTLEGVVVSDKNEKTVVVKVLRRFKHQKYSKFVHESKKYHAHDEKSAAKVGDNVTIIESKAYSKNKKWELVRVNN